MDISEEDISDWSKARGYNENDNYFSLPRGGEAILGESLQVLWEAIQEDSVHFFFFIYL